MCQAISDRREAVRASTGPPLPLRSGPFRVETTPRQLRGPVPGAGGFCLLSKKCAMSSSAVPTSQRASVGRSEVLKDELLSATTKIVGRCVPGRPSGERRRNQVSCAHSSSLKARGRAACSSPREIPARRALAEEVSLGRGANQVEGGLDDIGAGNRSSSSLLSCGQGGA